MDKLISYIKEKYNPVSVIVYGSFADGTNNLNSDFDALVISDVAESVHDTSFADGVQLDVFVYPEEYFNSNYDCADFVQLVDGRVVFDTDEIGAKLKQNVASFIENIPVKTQAQIKDDLCWCSKMLERVKRGDAEGMFRFHWLLVDSLEIFCNAVRHRYCGPKKALRWMEEHYPRAFELYNNALSDFTIENLSVWITYLTDNSYGE